MSRVAATLLALLAVTGAGCGAHGGSATTNSSSCALIVEYRGHTFSATHVAVAPREAGSLGTAALPPCNDTGTPSSGGQGEEIELAAIEGVPPTIAVAWHGRDDLVLVNEDADPHGLSAWIGGLLTPRCDRADEPIELTGRWLGVVGIGGGTEIDLVPPYDLVVRVDKSSAPRYERAELRVRVPAGLGRPLGRADVESSLGHGGTLSLVVRCRSGGFVAERVEAHPGD